MIKENVKKFYEALQADVALAEEAAEYEKDTAQLSDEELDLVNAASTALADEVCANANCADLPQYERRV